jgi:hypothetical protein
MLKTITKSAMFSSLVLGLVSVTNQVALAAVNCTVNGREVPCEELGDQIKGFLGWGIAGFLVILALGIWATVFWIMMIVHAATHDIENKAMWIILMVFTGIVGALIYYFAVKRKFNK